MNDQHMPRCSDTQMPDFKNPNPSEAITASLGLNVNGDHAPNLDRGKHFTAFNSLALEIKTMINSIFRPTALVPKVEMVTSMPGVGSVPDPIMPRCRVGNKKGITAGFATASLLVALAHTPMSAEAQVLSVPKLPQTARGYQGTNTNIADYNSVTALETAINQLRRNEEAIMGLCPNSIATLDLPDQATWNGYNADQKALLIVNEERRARGGVIYPYTSGNNDQGPRGAVQGYPFSGVPKVVDDAAEWWTDWLRNRNLGIQHCNNAAPANRRCPMERIRDFGGNKTPHGGLEGMAGNNATDDASVAISGILMFTYGTSGHRYGVLSQGYPDDFGNKREEGYVGFGTVPGMLAFKMGDTPSDEYMRANGNLTYSWNAKTSDLPGCTRYLAATPNSQAIIAGRPYTVNWTSSPCFRQLISNIRIRMSVDGGETFPDNLIITQSTPVSDGTETITIPANVDTSSAVIKIESVGSNCHYFSDQITAPNAPVIGIDFDTGSSTNTPSNWTKITPQRAALPSGMSFSNLRLDDGNSTGVSLKVTAANCGVGGCAFPWNPGGSRPQHTQDLSGLGGISVMTGTVQAEWSNLSPNTAYRIYVFGLHMMNNTSSNNVQITNGAGTVSFNQPLGTGRVTVNDTSSAGAPLSTYSKTVTSSSTGTITISMTAGSGSEVWLSGLALQSPTGNYSAQGTGTGTGTGAGTGTGTGQTAQATATAATSVEPYEFTANWNAVSGATQYLVDVSTDSNFQNLDWQNEPVNGTNVIVDELEPNTTYYYRVRAVTAAGNSGYSNVITVQTLPEDEEL